MMYEYKLNKVCGCNPGTQNINFVSSRLHLPHGLGEMESAPTFCNITYVNINGLNGNGRKRHTLNSYTITYSVIQKDGLNFVCLYFLNYISYVNYLQKI